MPIRSVPEQANSGPYGDVDAPDRDVRDLKGDGSDVPASQQVARVQVNNSGRYWFSARRDGTRTARWRRPRTGLAPGRTVQLASDPAAPTACVLASQGYQTPFGILAGLHLSTGRDKFSKKCPRLESKQLHMLAVWP